MRLFRWALVVCFLASLASLASSQTLDTSFGFNAMAARAGLNSNPPLTGGLVLSTGAEWFLPKSNGFGIGAETAWRASQASFFGQPARPMFWDINGVYQWQRQNRIQPEVMVGAGSMALSTSPTNTICGTPAGCTVFTNSNHLSLHLGLAAKIYLGRHAFVRPEVHYYDIKHDIVYGVPNAWRAGVSVGYTFGGGGI